MDLFGSGLGFVWYSSRVADSIAEFKANEMDMSGEAVEHG